jgi:acyl-CoA reductase-like NAD-dependent aldehyde dehydrogenase
VRRASARDASTLGSRVTTAHVSEAEQLAFPGLSGEPFGGNRLSGTGGKAGGPDYLLEFSEPRVVCENTTRHGVVV